MDITTRLQLLEAVRRAEQADAAYTAAGRACTRAAVDAHTDIGRCEQQLAAAPARAQTRAAANALEAAQQTDVDCGRRKQTAQVKLRRAFTAARTANRELAALYAPHAHSRGTGGKRRSAVAADVLEELAAMPLEMIRAADALVIQSTFVL